MPTRKHSFIWDSANTTKLWVKHNVRPYEVEEAFADAHAVVGPDARHSVVEDRYIVLGKTRKHRLLYIVYGAAETDSTDLCSNHQQRGGGTL